MKKELVQAAVRAALAKSGRIKITIKRDAAKSVVYLRDMEKVGSIKLDGVTDLGMVDLMNAIESGKWETDEHRVIIVTLPSRFFNENWFINKLSPNLERIEVVD